MDLRYANALRNATYAWANNRPTDTLTLQELKRRKANDLDETQVVQDAESAQNTQMEQPLARFGNLGTRLNIFA